jgi:DNA-binding NtrC family response regulator
MLDDLLGDLMVGVTRGTARGRRVRLDGRLRIGSAADNDLVLVDEGVVPHHCELVRDGAALLARTIPPPAEPLRAMADFQTARLGAGSTLRVGEAELLVHRAFDPTSVAIAAATHFGRAVGQSEGMRLVFAVLAEVGPTELTLLIQGEPGTGKRLLAQAVHEDGPRQMGPFVLVDCSSDPQLVESELFGGDEAEPGEDGPLQGALEIARGGTLVLDEVSDLPLGVQARLMRVCENRSLERPGGRESVAIDVRLVSTSSRSLCEEVQRGKFRADLYFRLSAASVDLSPLRERRDDLPLLIEHILAELRRRDPRLTNTVLAPDVRAFLEMLDWPGNTRELKEVVAQGLGTPAARTAPGSGRPDSWIPGSSDAPPSFQPESSYRKTRAAFQCDFERRYVEWLLRRHQGNISAAAREAKMDRKHLYDLARKHGLRFSSRPP